MAHDRWLDRSGAVLGRAEGRLGWAAYHQAANDLVHAQEHAAAALAHATEPRQPLALLAAHRLLGELDTAEGHHADAQAHLDAALGLADASAAPYERALTLLASAELRAAEGLRVAGRTLLAEARDPRSARGQARARTRRHPGGCIGGEAMSAPTSSNQPYVFVSYASADRERADVVVWLEREDIHAGRSTDK